MKKYAITVKYARICKTNSLLNSNIICEDNWKKSNKGKWKKYAIAYLIFVY